MDFVMGLCHQVTVLDYGEVIAPGRRRSFAMIRGCWTPTSARREEDDDDPG